MINKNNLNKIIQAEDELHYLQNLIEYCDSEGISLEDAVQDRIADLYQEIENLEK